MTDYRINMLAAKLSPQKLRSYTPQEYNKLMSEQQKKNNSPLIKAARSTGNAFTQIVMGEIAIAGAAALISGLAAIKHIKIR